LIYSARIRKKTKKKKREVLAMGRYRELLILLSVIAICALTVWRGSSPTEPDNDASEVEVTASPQRSGASPRKSVSYPAGDLSIGGIFLGESRQAVFHKLGKSKDDPLLDDYCHYPEVRVQFYNDIVHRISGTQLDYQGTKLLTPQMSPHDVGKLMSGCTLVYAHPGPSYGYNGDDWELRVELSNKTYPIGLAKVLAR
jgi:hypothetical protein